VPTEVDPEAVNKWLFNVDTVDKVLETLMTRGLAVAGGDRLGKTIIFARNIHHADFIVERFNSNYPHHKGSFARVIAHQTKYSQNLIDEFSSEGRPPHIVVSVDMLDTGIDVPEVVNLVFFKAVRSRTKFWQMIGRGTRLCANLFGPDANKTEFLIFDVCRNFEYFGQNPQVSDGRLTQSLGTQLFKKRLALLDCLDARAVCTGVAGRVADAERLVRRETADLLHRIVVGMHEDNFLVRPRRQLVHRYRDRTAWDELDGRCVDELVAGLASLPSAARDTDEGAKRFDLLILRIQLCVLNGEPGFGALAERVRDLAGLLLEQTAVPAIREQQVFLDALTGMQWWTDVTVPMLEEARRRVRNLVRLIERAKRRVVYSEFTDQLGELTELSPLPGSGHINGDRFRAKVREFLRKHEDHIAIYKVRRNLALTSADLAELDRMLVESGDFDRDRLDRAVADAGGGLGVFVRSLIGLDPAAVNEALSVFVSDTTLTANQIEFLGLVVDHLTRHGVLEPSQLFESPFNELAPRGPDVIFPERWSELVIALEDVRARAMAS